MTRLLVLCTHNSARSQMIEGWMRRHGADLGVDVEVWSAGTERTRVKPEAVTVMREVGIDLGPHRSKTLLEVPDPWTFDVVLTVCDEANEARPAYPARTVRRHVNVPDPSGRDLDAWRRARDGLGRMSRAPLGALGTGGVPSEAELAAALRASSCRPDRSGRQLWAATCG